ncbi:MAG: 16S rRNA (uracil(1498)-N(3))-methyltransferase [Geitlerinemataceae cyanobacterium]
MAELRRITLSADRRDGDCFRLTSEARHYLCRVLRLVAGDRCIVADGGGGVWETELVGSSPDCDGGELVATIVRELPESVGASPELAVPLVLVAAVPKGSGFDEVVRQVTELGVTTIAPVTSDRTVLVPSPKRVERWRRIATEAFEQCERAIVPQVLTPQPFATWLRDGNAGTDVIKAIAIARDDAPALGQYVADELARGDRAGVAIAIGPEGGWTPDERELAFAAGFYGVSLGGRVLRAVTASVAATAIAATAIEARASVFF